MKFPKISQNLFAEKFEKILDLHQSQRWMVMWQTIPLLEKLAVQLLSQNIRKRKKSRIGWKYQFIPIHFGLLSGCFWVTGSFLGH